MSQAGHKALLILPAWSPYRNPCLPLGPASCQRFLFRCSWHQQGAGRAQWCGGGCWGCLCPLRPAQAGRDLQVLAPRGRTSHPSACREIGMVARGCCKGSSWSWRLIWRKKRKMQALKMKKTLRHGVRGCTVWPWPHPPAHSSAPSACLRLPFLAITSHQPGAGSAAGLKQSLLLPTAATGCSCHLQQAAPALSLQDTDS